MNDVDESPNIPQLVFPPCSPIGSIASTSGQPATPSPATTSESADCMCPICLDERESFHFLICGHKVCVECNRLLRANNCMDKCPVCRCPLEWMAYVEFNGENFVLPARTPQSVVQTVVAASRNHDAIREVVIEANVAEEDEQRVLRERPARVGRREHVHHGAEDWECAGNIACSVVAMGLVVMFAIILSS